MDLSPVVMIVSTVWIASEVALTQMKRSGGGDEKRDRSSLRVLWITITCGVVGGILLSHQRTGHIPMAPDLAQIIGLALIVAGIALRWIAIASLKQHFTVDVAIAKDHRIVRSGLYGSIRHPAYAGSLREMIEPKSICCASLCRSNHRTPTVTALA